MDLVLGLTSFVKDVFDADIEVTRLIERLSVLIYKAQRVFAESVFHQCEKQSWDQHSLQKKMYEGIISRAKMVCQDASEKARNMGMQPQYLFRTDKIAINLPFVRTKSSLRQAIEELQRMNQELKQKQDTQPFVKRKVVMIQQAQQCIEQERKTGKEVISFDPTLIDQPTVEMIATLEDTDIQTNSTWVQVQINLKGPESLISMVRKQKSAVRDLQTIIHRVRVQKREAKQMQVMTFNRGYFRTIYEKMRKVVPEIDYVSSKENTFQLWLQQIIKEKENPGFEEILISATKECLSVKKAKTEEGQQFLSFPEKDSEVIDLLAKVEQAHNWRLICKCLNKNGIFVKRAGCTKWEKIEPGQTDVGHGDCVAPMMRKPQKVVPAFWFQISLEMIVAS